MGIRLGVGSAALLSGAVILAGCGGGTSTPGGVGGTTVIAVASGNAQTGTVGQALTAPLVVKATASGVAVPNAVVNFTVTAGAGTLSAATATTDATGSAQVTWTLGTKAGATTNTVSAALKGGTGAALSFTAIAKAGPATAAKIDSATNNQRGVASQVLSKPVAALVTDQYGNGVSNASVSWTVSSGGGSVLPATSVTDSTGRAVTNWTLGPGNGTQTISATVSGLSVSGLVATATAIDIAISAITPDTLTAGTVATITGRGFTPDPSQNIITIGGSAVVATSATATSVTFTVPAGACAPGGPTPVTLSSSGATPPSLNKIFQPGQSVNLAVGQQMIITDPSKFCVNFAATGATESYLVGVTNSKDDATNLQPALISVATNTGASALIAAAGSRASYSAAPSFLQSALSASMAVGNGDWSGQSRRLRLHREAMMQFRQREMASVSGLRSLRPTVGANIAVGSTSNNTNGTVSAIVTPTAAGQVISVNVINLANTDGTYCSDFKTVRAVVKKIGTRGIWVEDTTDAAGGFTDADYQALSDQLDNQIYNLDVNTWGQPTDLDNNSKIYIVVSRQVNLGNPNVLGFVFSGDLFSPAGGAVGCKASNFGEVYYGKAPDSSYPRSAAILDASFIIAHEFTHIIQNGVRLNTNDLTVWEREGQATVSEALNGFAALGLQAHQNYGLDVAFQNFDTTKTAWFEDRFVDLADFYGFPNDRTAPKLDGAPEQCTLIQPSLSSTLGPCLGGRQAYGNSSMLIQYAVDRFGPTYAGGDAKLLSDLISRGDVGLKNISKRVGVSVDSLLSQYYAALYIDDRIVGANATLGVNTWNLTNVFEGSAAGSRLLPSTRLIPDSTGFVPYSQAISVRGGSNDYLRIFGSNRPATALRVRSSDDATPLPATMRVWVVRLQ